MNWSRVWLEKRIYNPYINRSRIGQIKHLCGLFNFKALFYEKNSDFWFLERFFKIYLVTCVLREISHKISKFQTNRFYLKSWQKWPKSAKLAKIGNFPKIWPWFSKIRFVWNLDILCEISRRSRCAQFQASRTHLKKDILKKALDQSEISIFLIK